MATIRNCTAQVLKLVHDAFDSGIPQPILREIIDEALATVSAAKAETTIISISAVKAERTVRAEIAEKAKSYTEPILTIKPIPCENIKKLFSTVASSKNASTPAATPRTAGGGSSSSADEKAAAPTPVPTPAPTSAAASSSLPISSADEKAAAAASIKSVSNELWGDIVDASPSLDDWKSRAMNLFEEFIDVPIKASDFMILFRSVPLHIIHKLVFTADSRSFSTKDLPEFLAKKDAAAFTAFIEDMVSKPAGRENITLRKLVWRLIQFFFIHNLKDVPNNKRSSTIEHLEYCIANVVIVVPSSKKITATSNDLRTYFKLSAEEVPSEQILREVAVIQAIQRFVLKEIHTLLIEHKVGKNLILTANSLQVEFYTQEGLAKFSETIKYDRKIHGWL